jgi:hypothetical protein
MLLSSLRLAARLLRNLPPPRSLIRFFSSPFSPKQKNDDEKAERRYLRNGLASDEEEDMEEVITYQEEEISRTEEVLGMASSD